MYAIIEEGGKQFKVTSGDTLQVDRAPEGDERDVTITITKPALKREAVGVGAKGGEIAEGGEGLPEGSPGESSGSGDLPDSPDVLPDVPDAPPDDQ